ncbi:MAG: hypothetical protein KGQ52_02510 [Alphaproteobacteria bacterium]|nr:hypothetical protein [Alphaproteobacteria bacterium]
MRRGRPLAVWGTAVLLLALWLAVRWPMLAWQERRLAAELAARWAGPVAGRLRPVVVRAAVPGPAPGRLLPPPGPIARVQPNRVPVMALAMPMPPMPPVPPPPLPAALAAAGAMPPPPVPALPLPAPVPAAASGFALADAAYARLRAGQRRQAAALFDAALALEPENRPWRAQRDALGRRWQPGGFALLRDAGGGAAGPAASPVLGGGQIGASIAFVPDPLARRPLALVARALAAAGPAGVRGDTAQAAVGIRQALLPGVSVSAERLIALGSATRGDWTLRLAAGGQRGRLDGYGEAGVLGNGQVYAGAQGAVRVLRIGPATLAAGSWASVQTGAPAVWRVDVGPAVAATIRGVRVQADWRQRVGGNAAPGSGPVITVSAGF